jgi:23S rRNA (guanosine2251-2'-O)-methyltransferase
LWLAGIHAVTAAIENPVRTIHRILATPEAAQTVEAAHARMRAKRSLPQIQIVGRPDIARLVPPGTVHQGLVAHAAPLPALDIVDLLERAEGRNDALIAILDQVTDPHNVGAVLRSAAAFGALGVVVTERHAPDETCALAKSASGALERMPLVRVTNLARALDELKKGGFWICGLAADAPHTLAKANLSGKIALALGAEGEGLRRLTRESCDHMIKLPMTGAVESLNVSNAAAVALYEFARLR